jgi:hypothetical protein
VLLVLERAGSVVLAGVTVAAAMLPGAITGPFLGAWLDVAKSRRRPGLGARRPGCCDRGADGDPMADSLSGGLALVAFTGALEGPSLVAPVSVRQWLAPAHMRGRARARGSTVTKRVTTCEWAVCMVLTRPYRQ